MNRIMDGIIKLLKDSWVTFGVLVGLILVAFPPAPVLAPPPLFFTLKVFGLLLGAAFAGSIEFIKFAEGGRSKFWTMIFAAAGCGLLSVIILHYYFAVAEDYENNLLQTEFLFVLSNAGLAFLICLASKAANSALQNLKGPKAE
jgi:hypothetical protein